MTARLPHDAPTLVVCPTQREARALFDVADIGAGVVVISGVGPIGAAITTTEALLRTKPRRVILAGIAGSYDTERLPLASACSFRSVRIDGIGAGSGAAQRSLGALGFDHGVTLAGRPLGDELPLAPLSPSDTGVLLTVCSTSAAPAEAELRHARHADIVAEDMEGFGVSLACRRHDVPLTIVRGISNRAGDRDHAHWCIDQALRAAGELLAQALTEDPHA